MPDEIAATQTPTRPRRRWRRLGCCLLLGLVILVCLVWLFSDTLLRSTVQSRASAALGVPVRIGRLRLFLPQLSVSLEDVRVGRERPLVRLDQLGVQLKSLPGLWGEAWVASLDAAGTSVELTEADWTEGSDLLVVLENLLAGDGGGGAAWAVPAAHLRGVRLTLPDAAGQPLTLRLEAVDLRDLADPALREAYPRTRLRLRGATLQDDAGPLADVGEVAVAWSVEDRRLLLQDCTADELRCADRLGADGRTRLGMVGARVLAALERLRQARPALFASDPDAEPALRGVEVRGLRCGSLRLQLTDPETRPAAQLDLESAGLSLERLSLQESGEVSLAGLELADTRLETAREGRHATAGWKAITIDELTWHLARPDVLSLRGRLRQPAFEAVRGPAMTRLAAHDGRLGLDLQLLPGDPPTLLLRRVEARGLDLLAAVAPGRGPTAGGLLEDLHQSWRRALRLPPPAEATGDPTPLPRVLLQAAELADLRLHLADPAAGRGADLRLSLQQGTLANLSAPSAAVPAADEPAAGSAPATVRLGGLSVQCRDAERELLDGRWQSLELRGRTDWRALRLAMGEGSLRLAPESPAAGPCFSVAALDVELRPGEAAPELDLHRAERPVLRLTVGPEDDLLEVQAARRLRALLERYLPFAAARRAPAPASETAPAAADPFLGELLVTDATLQIRDRSRAGLERTLDLRIERALPVRATAEHPAAIRLQGLLADCYTPGKAGALLRADELTLGRSLFTAGTGDLQWRNLSLRPRRPDEPAYLALDAGSAELGGTAPLVFQRLTLEGLRTHLYRQRGGAWSYASAVRLVEPLAATAARLSAPPAPAPDHAAAAPDLDGTLALPTARTATPAPAGPRELLRIEELAWSEVVHELELPDPRRGIYRLRLQPGAETGASLSIEQRAGGRLHWQLRSAPTGTSRLTLRHAPGTGKGAALSLRLEGLRLQSRPDRQRLGWDRAALAWAENAEPRTLATSATATAELATPAAAAGRLERLRLEGLALSLRIQPDGRLDAEAPLAFLSDAAAALGADPSGRAARPSPPAGEEAARPAGGLVLRRLELTDASCHIENRLPAAKRTFVAARAPVAWLWGDALDSGGGALLGGLHLELQQVADGQWHDGGHVTLALARVDARDGWQRASFTAEEVDVAQLLRGVPPATVPTDRANRPLLAAVPREGGVRLGLAAAFVDPFSRRYADLGFAGGRGALRTQITGACRSGRLAMPIDVELLGVEPVVDPDGKAGDAWTRLLKGTLPAVNHTLSDRNGLRLPGAATLRGTLAAPEVEVHKDALLTRMTPVAAETVGALKGEDARRAKAAGDILGDLRSGRGLDLDRVRDLLKKEEKPEDEKEKTAPPAPPAGAEDGAAPAPSPDLPMESPGEPDAGADAEPTAPPPPAPREPTDREKVSRLLEGLLRGGSDAAEEPGAAPAPDGKPAEAPPDGEETAPEETEERSLEELVPGLLDLLKRED